jgi:hypothetical protein
MARPKKRGRPPKPPEDANRETVIHMKGSAAYVEWLESIHRKTRIPKVQLFRMAMEEWAERNKHPKPPEI